MKKNLCPTRNRGLQSKPVLLPSHHPATTYCSFPLFSCKSVTLFLIALFFKAAFDLIHSHSSQSYLLVHFKQNKTGLYESHFACLFVTGSHGWLTNSCLTSMIHCHFFWPLCGQRGISEQFQFFCDFLPNGFLSSAGYSLPDIAL